MVAFFVGNSFFEKLAKEHARRRQKEAKRREKDTERLTQKILKGDIRFLEVNSEVRAES